MTHLTAQPWMTAPETRAVMAALNIGGGVARFVGGCVRNALIGAPVDDIDIATALTPGEVLVRAQEAGLRAVETGIDHGTVTLIADGRPFEVTTLRVDVTTDGRRAAVAFTDDWARDAARRDFTINALYADETGTIFDFVGGLGDIAERRVRFIGDPDARIREDYLRSLRFFRFFAWYGAAPPDADALAAIVRNRAGLKGLSAERVQKEFLRLLDAPDPMAALDAMNEAGVTTALVPEFTRPERLACLIALDAPRDAILRLAAGIATGDASQLAARLKLSSAAATRLAGLVAGNIQLTDGQSVRRALYAHDGAAVRDFAYLARARHEIDGAQMKAALAAAETWTRPRFPLTGNDVTARGVAPGPRVGALLGALERDWIDENFSASRETLLARLDARLKAQGN